MLSIAYMPLTHLLTTRNKHVKVLLTCLSHLKPGIIMLSIVYMPFLPTNPEP